MTANNKGFSLVELLLYLAILSVVGAVTTGILTNVVRINVQETAGNEVASQLNSVMQTINSLVRQSSNIEIATSTTATTLKLRMFDKTKDPTCVYIASSTVKLAQGPDATNPQNCTSATSDLTTSKVTANNLTFQKITYYPGHDTVAVSIQLSYNSQNPQAQISRALQTIIGRVSAATFDDNLVPGTTNTYDVGLSGSLWKSVNNLIYFSGNNVGIGTTGPLSKLDINGGVAIGTYAGNNAAPANGLIVSGNVGIATTSPAYAFSVQGMSYHSTSSFFMGNVGVGTTNPGYKLDVQGGQINASGGLCMGGSCQTSWSGVGGGGWATSGNNIYNSNTGFVGVGTSTPSQRLSVKGAIQSGKAGIVFPDQTLQTSGKTLVWDYTVNSGVTSVTSPTLNGIADGDYEFEFWINELNANISMFVENDQTQANYEGTYLYLGNGVPLTGGYQNTPFIVAGASNSLQYLRGTISLSPSGRVFAEIRGHRANSGLGFFYTWDKLAAITNLTRIDIVSTAANAIGVGSRFRLWRKIPQGNIIQAPGILVNVPAAAIGSDGLPIMAYWNSSSQLVVFHCADAMCSPSSSNISTVVSSYGMWPSITIGTDGLPVVAYYFNDGSTQILHCGNVSCSSGNTVNTLDKSYMYFNSVAIGSDGFPVVAYVASSTTYALRVAHCGNVTCSSGNTTTTIYSNIGTGSVGGYIWPSVAIGTDGFPIISHRDKTTNVFKVTHCNDVACSSSTSAQLDTATSNTSTYNTSEITIGSDGLPVMVYEDTVNYFIKVAHCGNVSCSSGNTITTIDGTPYRDDGTIAIGTDGLPITAYRNSSGATQPLIVTHCGNVTCTSGNYTVQVDPNQSGFANILIGANGLPWVEYYNGSTYNMYGLSCRSLNCAPY